MKIEMLTCVAGTYFDNFAVLELSAMSLALNSHSVISPSAGGGGKTDNEDIDFRKPVLFSNRKINRKMAGRCFYMYQAFSSIWVGRDWVLWRIFQQIKMAPGTLVEREGVIDQRNAGKLLLIALISAEK